jgi:hypothetical protein
MDVTWLDAKEANIAKTTHANHGVVTILACWDMREILRIYVIVVVPENP